MPMLLSFRFNKRREKKKTKTKRKGNLPPKCRINAKRIPQPEKKFETERESRGPNKTDKATPNRMKEAIKKKKELTKKEKKNTGGLLSNLKEVSEGKCKSNVRKWIVTKKEKQDKQDRKNRSNKPTEIRMTPREPEKRLTLQRKWYRDCNDKGSKMENCVGDAKCAKMKLKREEHNDFKFVTSTEKSDDANQKRKKMIGWKVTNHKMENRKGVKEYGIFHL